MGFTLRLRQTVGLSEGYIMIIDSRYEKLAAGLTGFSTHLSKGERVLIDAFDIPDAFVVGYGLDYRDRYRNLPYVAVLEPHELEEPS